MPDMTAGEARRRFADARVARLATVDDQGHPHLVPVVFALRGDELLTAVDRKPKRSPWLKRLRNIAAHPAVCLLVDEYAEDWSRLWWVRADGDARILPPDVPDLATREEYRAGLALLGEKYPQYRGQPPDGVLITVSVRGWHGWRASGAGNPAG